MPGRAGVEADFLCSQLRPYPLARSIVSAGHAEPATRTARRSNCQAFRLGRSQVDGPPKLVGRRDVPVLEVRLRAHLLLLFETERIHIEFGVAVDEMLEDDSGRSIAEFSLKVLLDLHGTFQRSWTRPI